MVTNSDFVSARGSKNPDIPDGGEMMITIPP